MLVHPPQTVGTPPMVGVCVTVEDFAAYVATVPRQVAPRVSTLVLHHTYRPTVAQWRGLASMQAMQRYYRGLGWSAAPHIYVAPDGIWLFTPLHQIGVHANAGNGSAKAGWYSIGIEMVGDYDRVRPSGAIWERTRAVLGILCRHFGLNPDRDIDPHHQYNGSKTCPGSAVQMSWVASEVSAYLARDSAPVPAPAPAIWTERAPILAPSHINQLHALRYLTSRSTGEYTPYDLREVILPEYDRLCAATGVDLAVVIAQLIHETGNLTSYWSQRPRRNPAGIGVTGVPGAGVWFNAWDGDAGSCTAHVGRLLAYATAEANRTPVQQHVVDLALRARPLPAALHGSAPLLYLLGAGRNPNGAAWAKPGLDYGAKLADIAARLCAVSV